MPGIATTTPEIMIAHVGQVTSRIRLGAGGVMLPNHSSLKVAESYRLLEALHPGRIDLGIGRAPGTDPLTAVALRRSRSAPLADDFLAQLAELSGFGDGTLPPGHPFAKVRAMPDDVSLPPIWLLGSSDYSANLAAELGLGFAFAGHFSPDPAERPMRLYRERFQPGRAVGAARHAGIVRVLRGGRSRPPRAWPRACCSRSRNCAQGERAACRAQKRRSPTAILRKKKRALRSFVGCRSWARQTPFAAASSAWQSLPWPMK